MRADFIANDALKARIRRTGPSSELLSIWNAHDEKQWRTDPALYLELARRFVGNGDGLLAHEVLVAARSVLAAPDPLIEHQYGLVLARTGATERAAQVALALCRQLEGDGGASDVDNTLLAEANGLLARTEKDLALRAGSAGERERHLRRSFDGYRTGYERTQRYYLAINAATLALLLGESAAAREYARSARAGALAELAAGPSPWAEATLGEAALIEGDRAEAGDRYTAAARALANRFDDLATMRRQAGLILRQRGEATEWLDDVFAIPNVIAFAATTALPAPHGGRAETITRIIRNRLEHARAGFGFSAASPGSEIIFLEEMMARGGHITIVLPCRRAEYERDYVAPAGDAWFDRFTRLVETQPEIVEASWSAARSRTAVDYASLLLAGLAAMQSQFLDTQFLALVDDATQQARVIAQWRAHGHDVQLLTFP